METVYLRVGIFFFFFRFRYMHTFWGDLPSVLIHIKNFALHNTERGIFNDMSPRVPYHDNLHFALFPIWNHHYYYYTFVIPP